MDPNARVWRTIEDLRAGLARTREEMADAQELRALREALQATREDMAALRADLRATRPERPCPELKAHLEAHRDTRTSLLGALMRLAVAAAAGALAAVAARLGLDLGS